MLRLLKGGKLLQELRDQVNIRRHVDQVKEPVPKKQGGGGWLSGPLAEADVAQLRAHVEAMVCAETYKKPKAIEVPALRREPAAPHATKYAKTLEGEREAKLEVLREKLQKCMADGSFKAVLRSARRPKQLKALKRQQKAREVSEAEREQLEDSTFEDEGITWKVMKVQWDDSLGSIIVFYYDMQSAEREMIGEDDLHEDHEYVEHSSLEEVLSWISS